MPLNVITAKVVPGNAGLALMGRLVNYTGTLVTQASISSIAYSVYDLDADASLATGTFTVASVVYDTLQQSDAAWTKDSASKPGTDGRWGYNFKAILPATDIPIASSGDRVQVDVAFTPASGQKFRLVYQFDTTEVFA